MRHNPRVGIMRGVLHRVEVIEVAEELVEAMHRRQELVEVAECKRRSNNPSVKRPDCLVAPE